MCVFLLSVFLSIIENGVLRSTTTIEELSISPFNCQFLLRIFSWSVRRCVSVHSGRG